MADQLGSAKVANIVMLGALLEETGCLLPTTAMRVLEAEIKKVEPARTRSAGLERGPHVCRHSGARGGRESARRIRLIAYRFEKAAAPTFADITAAIDSVQL
jgi:hypothetical protein